MTTDTYTEYVPTFSDRKLWNLSDVLRHHARVRPDSIYLDVPWQQGGLRYSYKECLTLAESIGRNLLDNGCQPGDRVVVMMPNRAEYILARLGLGVARLVEVSINVDYKGTFLAHQISTVSPHTAIVDPGFVERFLAIPEACSTLKNFVLCGAEEECAVAQKQLTQAGYHVQLWHQLATHTSKTDLPQVRHHDLAEVFFTSGTTGLSKGVMMTHAHIYLFADETKSLTRLTERDVYMSCGPQFHGNSSFLAQYPALIAGARYVLQERFSATGWVQQIREAGATVTNFIGVMMDFVWQQPETSQDSDNKLRCIFAAPTASSIVEGFKTRFGIEAFVEVFGLTETCMPILTPYGVDRPPGAAGKLNTEWFDVRLVNSETDEEVAVGEVGELIVRSKFPWTSMLGYYNMPEKTAEAFRNLWFHTGDGLRRDADGWYYFVDRLKDALRRRGENISSFEVEHALLPHPAIKEVAVVGVPAQQEAGEDEVMAFIVLCDGASLDPQEFWQFAEQQLPYFAVPRYLRIIAELPKTPSEKIRKVDLRAIGVDAETHDHGPIGRKVRREVK